MLSTQLSCKLSSEVSFGVALRRATLFYGCEPDPLMGTFDLEKAHLCQALLMYGRGQPGSVLWGQDKAGLEHMPAAHGHGEP